MTDKEVRKAFHEKVLSSKHFEGNSITIDELGLKNGEIRADIAVICQSLIGFEIKTDSDTLKRLGAQMEAYNDVFDNVYCVVGKRHYRSVIALVPKWWGIYLIDSAAEGLFEFDLVREASENGAKKNSEIVKLLWKEEAKSLAKTMIGVQVKSRHTKEDLYNFIVEEYDSDALTQIVSEILLSRVNWRTSQNISS